MRQVVSLVTFNRQKRLLIVQSRKHQEQDIWTLPGGKVEAGESYLEALVREVLEEISVEVQEARQYRIFRGQRARSDEVVKVVTFFGKIRGRAKPSNEIARMAWVSSADFSKIGRLSKSSKLIVDTLMDDGHF